MEFSLKSLLIVVTLLTVTLGGLIYATRIWAACFFTTFLLLLLYGVVQALVARGPSQAYWIGFIVFGGVYFLFSLFAEAQPYVDESGRVRSRREARLVTSEILILLDAQLNRAKPPREFGAGTVYPHPGSAIFLTARGSLGHTFTIGHTCVAILLGMFGGAIAQWSFERRNIKRSAT